MLRLVLRFEIVVERLVLPEYTISPEQRRDAKLPVPPVREANLRVPVNVGLAVGAFASSEDWREDTVAMEREELGKDTDPMAVRLSQFRRPVKAGEAMGAFRSKACCVRAEIGLSTSALLSTFPKPASALVILEL